MVVVNNNRLVLSFYSGDTYNKIIQRSSHRNGVISMTRLKELRVASGLSQQALAEKFNLSQQSIYKYENGLAEPDIKTLRGMAHFFGVSIDFLVGEDTLVQEDINNQGIILSNEEILLIRNYRKLDNELRVAIHTLIMNTHK